MASSLQLTNNAGTDVTIDLDGEVAVSGGPPEARVVIGKKGQPGKIVVRDFNGEQFFRFESPFGAHMFVGSTDGLEGFIHVISGLGKEGVLIDGAGTIKLMDKNGNVTITLEGGTGDIKLSGADCAEMFDVSADSEVDAGTVLVMDGDGYVHQCDRVYDQRVAGVVSGDVGVRPRLILNIH